MASSGSPQGETQMDAQVEAHDRQIVDVEKQDKDQPASAEKDKKYRASSAVTLKTLSAWDQARLSPWYSPRFWLDLLIHPSAEFKMNHVRRRARLFALVALCFLFVSIIANVIAYWDGRNGDELGVQLLSNLLMLIAYAFSRTKFATSGKTLGVFAVWILPYLTTILSLRRSVTPTGDVTVTDSVNWLFTPAWYLMAVIFLSRSMTMTVLVLDAVSLWFLPVFAGTSFYHVRKTMLFHMINGSLLLLASIISFRDKLQLYSQQDGQVHEDQHRAGTIARFLLQPHKDVTDRIFRRRARILGGFLLGLIPFSLIWTIMEATGWAEGVHDSVVTAIAACTVVASVALYIASRTHYTRWASRLTIFMLLIIPYLYTKGHSTTIEGQMYANLVTTTAAAILGVTLLSGPELVALSGIIFFFNLYSPYFPPHIVLSLILLAASLVYRRDIKEIHDTAFHRDDLYEDDSGDLLIPWEKRYLFNFLSYLQMVTTLYTGSFFLMLMLGITALIAAAGGTADTVSGMVISATVTPQGGVPDYILWVHVLDCPAGVSAQTYSVVGSTARFKFLNSAALNQNASNTLLINAGSVGKIQELSFSLGGDGYYVTQHVQCKIDSLELFDNRNAQAYSTDVYDVAATQTTSGRRLLENYDTGSNANTYYRGTGARDLRLKYRTGLCTDFNNPQSASIFVWRESHCACGVSGDGNLGAVSLLTAMVCNYYGGCSATEGCCGGHGTCYVTLAPGVSRYGTAISKTKCNSSLPLCATCLCDPFYGGDFCASPDAEACAAKGTFSNETVNGVDWNLGTYQYNGLCNQLPPLNDFQDGAVGNLLIRLVAPTEANGTINKDTYRDGIRTMIDAPAPPVYTWVPRRGYVVSYPNVTVAPPTDLIVNQSFSGPLGVQACPFGNGVATTNLNMFGLGLLEFALSDIVGLDIDNGYERICYGSRKPYPTLVRADEDPSTGTTWVGAVPGGADTAVPLQYNNEETGWIDASPIYGVGTFDNTYRAKNNLALLNETLVLKSFSTTVFSQEYIVVVKFLVRYHNLIAQQFILYFCGTYPAPSTGCTTGSATTVVQNVFELSRFSTIRFLQSLVEYTVIPSFFVNVDDCGGGMAVDDTSAQDLVQDFQFTRPLGPGDRWLASTIDYFFPLRASVNGTNATHPINKSPYLQACRQPTSKANDPFTNQLLNMGQLLARPWGSGVIPANAAALSTNLERARDLGLGNYDRYYNLLAVPGTSQVSGPKELLVGAQLETEDGYILSNQNVATTIPRVVLSLTASLLHSALAEDRLGIHGDHANNIVEQSIGLFAPEEKACKNVSGVCTANATAAWQYIRGGFAANGDFLPNLYTDPVSSGELKSILLDNYRAVIIAVAYFNGSQSTYPSFLFAVTNPADYLDTGVTFCFPRHISQTLPNDIGFQAGLGCGQCAGNPSLPALY